MPPKKKRERKGEDRKAQPRFRRRGKAGKGTDRESEGGGNPKGEAPEGRLRKMQRRTAVRKQPENAETVRENTGNRTGKHRERNGCGSGRRRRKGRPSKTFESHAHQLLDRGRRRFADDGAQHLFGRRAGEAEHDQRREGLVDLPAAGSGAPSPAPNAVSLPVSSTMIF